MRALILATCLVLAGRPVAGAEPPVAPATVSPTAEQWRADLEWLRVELPKRHPDPFAHWSQADYEAAFAALQAQLPTLAEHARVVGLARVVATLRDGHTRLTLPHAAGSGFFTGHTATDVARVGAFGHLPLRLLAAADGWLVAAVAPEHASLLGARVHSIDDRPIDEAAAAVAPVVHRDNDQQLRNQLADFLVVPEVLHASGVTRSIERATLDLELGDGSRRAIELARTTNPREDWRTLPADPRVERPAAESGGLWFRELAEPAAVYARIAEIADDPDETYAEFANRLGAYLAGAPARRLIIDLRGNPGGDNTLNPQLLRALLRTPWLEEPGALFVLTDGGTFSAAMNLAEQLEHWLPAIFVGGGTGGRPNHYGDARKLALPATGLTVRVSSLYWQNHPNDARDAIMPLLVAVPTIAQLRSGLDPALEALRVLQRAPADPAARAGQWRGMLSVPHRHAELQFELAADGLAGMLGIPAFGIERAPFRLARTGPDTWAGAVPLREYTATLALRFGDRQATGWINYRGNRFPLVSAVR